VYKTLVYLFLARSLVPHFGDIMYYFIINEIGFTKSLIAFLTLVGYLALFFGSALYNRCFKTVEYPKMMFYAQLLISFTIVLNMMFVS
jgi:hypothetical protein